MTLDVALRDLIREIVRDELRPIREELRAVAEAIQDGRKARDGRGHFLTVDEIAAELKVSRGTVRSWITSGGLRASQPGVAGRIGRVYRIERADLDSFLATKRSAPKEDVDIRAEAARIVAELARKRKR